MTITIKSRDILLGAILCVVVINVIVALYCLPKQLCAEESKGTTANTTAPLTAGIISTRESGDLRITTIEMLHDLNTPGDPPYTNGSCFVKTLNIPGLQPENVISICDMVLQPETEVPFNDLWLNTSTDYYAFYITNDYLFIHMREKTEDPFQEWIFYYSPGQHITTITWVSSLQAKCIGTGRSLKLDWRGMNPPKAGTLDLYRREAPIQAVKLPFTANKNATKPQTSKSDIKLGK